MEGYFSILFLLRGRGGGLEGDSTSASESEGSWVGSVLTHNDDTWWHCGLESVLAEDSVDAIVLEVEEEGNEWSQVEDQCFLV